MPAASHVQAAQSRGKKGEGRAEAAHRLRATSPAIPASRALRTRHAPGPPRRRLWGTRGLPSGLAPAERSVRPPSPQPPVAMGTGAGHAGLKETAEVKCYESSGCRPMRARGGGGGDQWLAASTEEAGLGALGGDGGAGGSVKRTRRRSELRVRVLVCSARSVPHRAGPAAPAKVVRRAV